MPYRKIILASGQIYHVFNRGVAALPIFLDYKSHLRFLNLVNYYRFSNTPFSFSRLVSLPKEERKKVLTGLREENIINVEILAYCLMPNHFHFLLKQITDKGISVFMKNLQDGYVKYFNIKNERVGPLFQSMFKAVRIETDEQLLHVSRYIHLNPSTAYIVGPEALENYKWSSLVIYLNKESDNIGNFVNRKIVMDFFRDGKDYLEFILNQASYQRELDKIKHLVLE